MQTYILNERNKIDMNMSILRSRARLFSLFTQTSTTKATGTSDMRTRLFNEQNCMSDLAGFF